LEGAGCAMKCTSPGILAAVPAAECSPGSTSL
jgi:hypothetical protein